MTQAFCRIVLHYSIASLSWKTIKSLRRSRSRLPRKKCDNDTVPTPTTHEDVSPAEYEILQGWTILAFHSLYVSLGIEYFVRFFIPFYFNVKMIVLIVTFVVPSWERNGGGDDGISEFGLSPAISYWFDYFIVPCVHRVHDLMDDDPKGWALQQLSMVPFWVIDYFILPGVLTTDEEKQLVRKMRSEGIICGGDRSKVPPSEALPRLIADANDISSDQCFDQSVTPDNQTKERGINDSSLSSETDTLAQKIRKKKIVEQRPAAEQPDDSESTHGTPPHGQKLSTLFNENTPKRTHTPLAPSTLSPNLTSKKSHSLSLSPAIKSKSTPKRTHTPLTPSTLSPNLTSKKSHSLSLSPAIKSRLASSAMRLRRISHEHRNDSGLLSPSATPHRGKASSDINVSKEEMRIKRIMESPPEKWSGEENETHSLPRKARRRRRERLSLGDHFRELVTGDANIRVRDHLFDLDLPSSSPRQRLRTRREKGLLDEKSKRQVSSSRSPTRRTRSMGRQKQNDASNVTSRRSSRLAQKKVSNSLGPN